jgi:hypothetical protein
VLPLFGPPVQVAYLVDDPAAAARRWEIDFGAGPFVVREHIEVTDVVVRGRPSTFDHTSAYGWLGTMMIELFCQHDDAVSVVTEWRERHGGRRHGLHHIACFVDNLDQGLRRSAAAGLPTSMTARAGDTRFAFVDDVDRTGHYWELYEPSEQLVAFYALIERRHREA